MTDVQFERAVAIKSLTERIDSFCDEVQKARDGKQILGDVIIMRNDANPIRLSLFSSELYFIDDIIADLRKRSGLLKNEFGDL